MNPAYDFNSSSSSSHFLHLNEPRRPGHEQYDMITNHAQPLLHQQATASSSACPTFFDYESWNHIGEYTQTHEQKVDQRISVPVQGSSAGHEFSASSYQPTDEDSAKDHIKMLLDHENQSTSTNGHGSMKWTSSKMRVMRKGGMPSNKSSETDLCIPAKSISDNHNLIKSANHWNSSTAEIVRVCSGCNTTKTPLWRGGPQGPKSLCNACGIRRRKARKAMALAASAQNDSDNVNKLQYYSSTKAHIIDNAEKRLHTNYLDVTQSHQTTATPSFEDFAATLINKKTNKLFPRDEEEGAILLMALSCGRIHR
ncbi:GATA transcription factor [Heracleum sosnowskyi]|uniref:GATA transcription factor n=1 Tax=Heracleum sosnowskyi TaxID=360622 RepID=A0AAD8HUZ5_9APIA|nr:GATA transcription factor [Heracleum sosnowskyi]